MKKLFFCLFFIFLFFIMETKPKITKGYSSRNRHNKNLKHPKKSRKLYNWWWWYWHRRRQQEAAQREREAAAQRAREEAARRAREEAARIERERREAARREAERLERIRRAQINKGPKPEICNLTVELYPLYYYPITRIQEFVLAFSSNCLMRKEVFFQLELDDNKHLNWNYHPNSINLKLWDNYYMIDYKNPRTLDRFDVMKSLEYTEAKISHILKEKDKINTTEQNGTNLDPQKLKSFNKYTLRKISETDFVECVLRPIRVKGWEVLMKIAEKKKALADKLAKIPGDGTNKEVKTTKKPEDKKKSEDTKKPEDNKNITPTRKLKEEAEKDGKKIDPKEKKRLEDEKKAEAQAKALRKKKREEEAKKRAEHIKKLNELDQKLRKEFGAKLLKQLKDVHFIEKYEMDCSIN